ncbi:O-antigen translocase [Carboxylicivirga linearis]|uniref:O-antigen translocase n=1 Tax=Carboxylicivirga linearis TaxID=1628157 RepID=A0ABS5JTQ4_9BACT|nr:O-antigen translocase [Carboxylicivirga linearis]MBS2098233.1 O-antigen translocase [Carboxylicivirga linearis]
MPIKNTFAFIKNNLLLRTSIKNASQVIVRFILAFLNIKILAYFIGPSGLAIIGQFQNYLQLGANIGSGGINKGIIKLLADDKEHKSEVISTGIIITGFITLIVSIITFIFSNSISVLLFDKLDYTVLIKSSSIYLFSTSLLNLYLAIFNGLQKLNLFIKTNLITFISAFLSTSLSVYFWGLHGVIWGVLLSNIFAATWATFLIKKHYPINEMTASKITVLKLTKFSLMTLVSGIISPLLIIIIRKLIIANTSMDAAGIWEGINRISSNYISLITMSFSYYFLPRFSSLKNNSQIKKELKQTYLIFIPILVAGAIALYLLRDIIISLLFTEAFQPISQIIHWQLLGDIFKILAWIFAILLIAKEKVKTYIFTELLSFGTQIVLAFYMLPRFGIEGSTLYYFLSNLIYFLILLLIIYYKLLRPDNKKAL